MLWPISIIIRSVKNSNSIPPTILYNGVSTSASFDKVSLFNDYFFSVFTTSFPASSWFWSKLIILTGVICYQYKSLNKMYLMCLLYFILTRSLELMALVAVMCSRSHKATATSFSTSLSKCSIPYEWRIHTTVLIHKSGDKAQATICHPLSLLSTTLYLEFRKASLTLNCYSSLVLLVYLVDFGCDLNPTYLIATNVWRSITVYLSFYRFYSGCHKVVYWALSYFLSM